MSHILVRFACLIVCGAVGISASAQQQPAAPSLPQNPAELMALAHDKTGLTGPDVHPWHIRGTYTFYDADGKIERTGVYEEWWVAPGKYKRSFTSPKFSQTDYGDGTHLFREGEQGWPNGYEMLLRSLLVSPIPDSETLKNFIPQEQTVSANNISLTGVRLSYALPDNPQVADNYFSTYYFGPHIPVLRVSTNGSTYKTVYDNYVLFQGHYVPREIHVVMQKKLLVTFAVDLLEEIKGTPESVLLPSVNAKPVDLSTISFVETKTHTNYPISIKKIAPRYPEDARRMHIDGIVTLHATITKEGNVTHITAVDGQWTLRKEAIDAVSQWIYQPFVVLDKPVQVETRINVIFSLPAASRGFF